jgi:hypothetical protein
MVHGSEQIASPGERQRRLLQNIHATKLKTSAATVSVVIIVVVLVIVVVGGGVGVVVLVVVLWFC